ncbi:hypothetical protein [Guyparkeria sp.]|uniref:hypothetical protein n=1 Tax=Guyparkeria sp. TaxID=2035736 RepID=UPI0039711658
MGHVVELADELGAFVRDHGRLESFQYLVSGLHRGFALLDASLVDRVFLVEMRQFHGLVPFLFMIHKKY